MRLYRRAICREAAGGLCVTTAHVMSPRSHFSHSDTTASSGAGGDGGSPRRFQGLQSIGTSTVNMPTTALGGTGRRKSFAVKEWSEGQLSEVQDALRELREYDLDDPYYSLMSKEDEGFLESAELHASMKASTPEAMLSQLNANANNNNSYAGDISGHNTLSSNDGSGLGSGISMPKEKRESLQKRLMGYRKMLMPNPFGHVKIYRSEAGGSEVLPTQLSVDVNPRKMRELLNDYDGKRCILCNEPYQTWHIHQNFIPHSAREAIVFELLRPFCGTPDEIVRMWWWRLHYSKRFRRIRELSHSDPRQRKKRLLYILKFLRDRQVIRESFNVNQLMGAGVVSSGRSWEFERLEFIGDNVVKYLFNDRFNVIFPVHEGGVKGKAAYCQFMIDGNDGLARAYDFLEFHKLTESDRVVSKFKSDVMETVFGELQLYLWSTEVDDGAEQHQLPFTPEYIPLRAIVWHAMEELGHVMLMYHLEYVLGIVNGVVKQHNLNFIRADPALRTNLEMQRELASSVYSARKMASQKRFITPAKVSFPFHDTALMAGRGAIDGQKQVQQVGGLLPRPFGRNAIGASHMFMDHLTMIVPSPLVGTLKSAVAERERVVARQEAAEREREVAAVGGGGGGTTAPNLGKDVAFTSASLGRLSDPEAAAVKRLVEDVGSSAKGLQVTPRGYRVLQKGLGAAALLSGRLSGVRSDQLSPVVEGLVGEEERVSCDNALTSAPVDPSVSNASTFEGRVEYPDDPVGAEAA